ncbi:MAG: hypothetical protein ABL949_07940 [Fimbriimonadaceae bacterium]
MRRAVVDVGSNSVLLLVCEFQGGRWNPVLETSAVTALGEGTKQTGLLSERAITDTLKALKHAFDAAGTETIQAGVTMAARIATNTEEFLARAEAQGTPVRVLSGEEEAELGFRSVADDPTFAPHSRIAIIDVGGHSTELVIAERGTPWKIHFRKSFPIGTLALRGGHLVDETPSGLDILRASQQIDDLIGMSCLPNLSIYAIALGATGTNLVTIRERMTHWDPDAVHGAYLDFEEVSKAVGWLSSLTDEERAMVPGMESGRERTIHLGCLILERFLHSLRVLGCGVSVRGWRHALLERM